MVWGLPLGSPAFATRMSRLPIVSGPREADRARAVLGMYADVVRESLGISHDLKLLFGISFGTAGPAAPVNDVHMHRLPLSESVKVHGG